jgi:putative peptidoglycan lipid II flippase
MRARLAKLWSSVPRGAVMLSMVTALNVALGFAREGVIAYYFGASAELDTFLVAYTLPRIITFQAVAFSAWVVLPQYVAHLERGEREKATQLVRRWAIFLAKATTGFCLIVALFANVITSAIGPGLSEAQQASAANWLRLLLPLIWLITMSGCFKLVLDNNRRFFMPALSAVLVNAGAILGCLLGAATMGVSAMIPGLLVGGLVGFALQWRQAHAYEPTLLSLRNVPEYVKLPLASSGIVVLNSFAQQTNVVIDRAFASSLPDGSIAALNYANSVISVPQSIITGALATALFPVLARLIARDEWRKAYSTTVKWAIVVVAFGVLPVTAMALWGHDMIALLFQRGAFGDRATDMTATAMFVLSFVLLATGANSMVVRLLLAQQQLRFLLTTTILSIGIKIVANAVLVGRYGMVGVASATVIATSVAVLVRFWGAATYRGKAELPQRTP